MSKNKKAEDRLKSIIYKNFKDTPILLMCTYKNSPAKQNWYHI